MSGFLGRTGGWTEVKEGDEEMGRDIPRHSSIYSESQHDRDQIKFSVSEEREEYEPTAVGNTISCFSVG